MRKSKLRESTEFLAETMTGWLGHAIGPVTWHGKRNQFGYAKCKNCNREVQLYCGDTTNPIKGQCVLVQCSANPSRP